MGTVSTMKHSKRQKHSCCLLRSRVSRVISQRAVLYNERKMCVLLSVFLAVFETFSCFSRFSDTNLIVHWLDQIRHLGYKTKCSTTGRALFVYCPEKPLVVSSSDLSEDLVPESELMCL